ncbi:pyridoxal phosphate-dependent aminotransferase [Peptoniphilus raoultii]|uniref:pyridoxal phosphate-dependent aminotransferase n=1 Tax=Peptoniphilus raoultii TaxID=1776387 RepID=UPI0008DA71E7|nr:histidinol-phosphate transaminase [Peptoniphilus raoultii]
MENFHGANLFELARELDCKTEDIMDFSSNINPLSPSSKALEFLRENLSLIRTYPDPNYKDLKAAISSYAGGNFQNIILGLGSTEVLSNAIEIIRPKKSLLLSPCYSEYEKELKKARSEIFYYPLREKNNFAIDLNLLIDTINKENIDLFVFANPNNPTGSILLKDEIKSILEKTKSFVLTDETYVEFTDMNLYSAGDLTKSYENLLVTRGTSKFFGVPGLRLGYGLTSSKKLLEAFKNREILWQINICADLMGQKMFSDKEYIKKVYEFMKNERERIFEDLSEISSLKLFKSYGNFILVKIKGDFSAKDLREKLKKSRIIIRDLSNFKGLSEKYFRFCLLDKNSNQIFSQKLKELLYEKNI